MNTKEQTYKVKTDFKAQNTRNKEQCNEDRLPCSRDKKRPRKLQRARVP